MELVVRIAEAGGGFRFVARADFALADDPRQA